MTTPMPQDDPRGPSAPGADDTERDAPDYLWDRSGAADPLVERLETLLAASGLKNIDAPTSEPVASQYGQRLLGGAGFFRASRVLPLAAALALLVSIGAWLALREPVSKQGWYVDLVSGSPRAAGRTLEAGKVLTVGEWLVTDAASSARVKVPRIGSVDIAPNSRLRIEDTGASKHLVYLDHGKIRATISAPPRLFYVDTRAALATDMGCAYDLDMPPAGPGLLTVTLGWVQLDGKSTGSAGTPWAARVPRGSCCVIYDRLGPGTPFTAGAMQLRNVLAGYDTRGWETVTDAEFAQLLAMCGSADGVTVWHLLYRFDGLRRAQVFDRITVLFTLQRDMSVEAVLALDEDTMHNLWLRIAWP